MKRQAFFERIRTRLLKLRRQLLESVARELHELEGQFGHRWLDDDNEAVDAEADDMISWRAERGTHDLERVEAALSRLHADTYGRCTVCGRSIALERLEALPLTTTCVYCQRKSEAHAESPRQIERDWPDRNWWSNGPRSARSLPAQMQF